MVPVLLRLEMISHSNLEALESFFHLVAAEVRIHKFLSASFMYQLMPLEQVMQSVYSLIVNVVAIDTVVLAQFQPY